MNSRNIQVAVFAVLAIVGLLVFFGTRPATQGQSNAETIASGNTISISMRALENSWTWEPNIIEANVGDRVVITAINEDEYAHGLAIPEFGIDEVLPPQGSVTVEFVPTREGNFDFACSVQCGIGHSGMVGGVVIGPAATGA